MQFAAAIRDPQFAVDGPEALVDLCTKIAFGGAGSQSFVE